VTDHPWRVDIDVREDAERLFVPAGDLPGASVGEMVELHSTLPPGRHRGRIIQLLDDPVRGRYLVVTIE
jgi:hypothetical protein